MRRTIRPMAVLLALCLCFITVLVNTDSTHAASGLTVSPPLKEITLGPGLIETTAEVLLQNNTSQQISAHLQLVDLKALGTYGGTSIDKAGLPDKYDLANWMSLPEGDVLIIPSGQTVKAKVKIINRSDLAPGGHYGAVIITSSAAGGVKSDVNISQQVVSLLFVKKLGGEVYGIQMEPFTYSGSSIPNQITTRFKSTGNVHVIPRGYIEVTDPKGKLVSKGIINEDSNIILPGSTRQFMTLMQNVASANAPGRYKITVHYRYDGQKDFMTESIYFTHGSFVVPILVGLSCLSVLTIAGVYVVRKMKHTKRMRTVR